VVAAMAVQILELLQGDDQDAQVSAASLCQSLAFNDFTSGNAMLHHGAPRCEDSRCLRLLMLNR
jgi:hypothetical protein